MMDSELFNGFLRTLYNFKPESAVGLYAAYKSGGLQGAEEFFAALDPPGRNQVGAIAQNFYKEHLSQRAAPGAFIGESRNPYIHNYRQQEGAGVVTAPSVGPQVDIRTFEPGLVFPFVELDDVLSRRRPVGAM